jgi:hypothetical protein
MEEKRISPLPRHHSDGSGKGEFAWKIQEEKGNSHGLVIMDDPIDILYNILFSYA